MNSADYHPAIISADDARQLARKYFGITGTAKVLAGFEDLNFYLKTQNGEEFILKISPPGANAALLDMQNRALTHLAKKNLPLTLPIVISNLDGERQTIIKMENREERPMRLLNWVPGRLFAKVNPHTPELLESLGRESALLCKGLSDFDHPAAHRAFKWDISQAIWVKEYLDVFAQKWQRELVEYFLELFEKEALPKLPDLRKSFIHNDPNDYNVVVNENLAHPEVVGMIDFGDAIFTHTINELATASAYAILDKPDPLTAAAHLVRGFHKTYPLEEEEVAVLFPLIAARLLISVTSSTLNRLKEPENEYLFVSERPAWDLLKKWRAISPALAHYTFRHACGWEPCLKRVVFQKWIESERVDFEEVVNLKNKNTAVLDLSVGSLDLGHNENFEKPENFRKTMESLLEEKGAEIGLGGYGEVRPFYSTDAYVVEGNEGPQWRTVHVGLDIWAKAGTPVFAPLDGFVHSFQNNKGERNYGPTIILEHRVKEDLTFYTLYGHLSLESLDGLKKGMSVQKGQTIAAIGDMSHNGIWPPHLHFQVILDMLGWKGDFPGVAFPNEKEVWLSVCPNPMCFYKDSKVSLSKPPAPPAPKGEGNPLSLLEKRRQLLGPNLSLSYKKPLHITRAYMQYMYSSDGRRYLDTVNNVPHVGHQHPRIVRAAQRQVAVLNTNSRYLHETILDYAGELLAMFPPELCVCYFVNSGSEANELALRIARTVTGWRDMIVIENGYHGNTTGCVEVSSYKFDGKGGKGAPPHIHVVPMPDPFRGAYRKDDPEAGKKYAAHVQQSIEKVKQNGEGIAGFIVESILSCGGQIVPPGGYLKDAFEYVRKAGGLCIADEVQVGFGRVGDAFWAFELQGVVPDIVTLGKPIGNGFPLGAVVTTRTVAEAFDNGMEFFSTFGGNPVSCAVGREVLSVIKDENLQNHALETGNYLIAGLKILMEKYSIIGDVRGHGLFLGFELVKNPKTLEPATDQAAYLKNRMRELGILMSTDGPFENVLKIKPPLCFDKSNVDFLVGTLDRVMGEDFIKK